MNPGRYPPLLGIASRTAANSGSSPSNSRTALTPGNSTCSPTGLSRAPASFASATNAASWSRMSRWGDSLSAELIGPGTAINGLPSRRDQLAVFRAPDRAAASTTSVPPESAAISLFRARKPCLVGRMPGGISVTTTHSPAIWSSNRLLPRGYHPSSPPAMTATVGPPTDNAPDAPQHRCRRHPH